MPAFSEVVVPIGGSGQIQVGSSLSGEGPVDYDIALTVGSLPPGTTASVTPATITPGQSATVTLSAAADAPISQNTAVTITGVPSAPVVAAAGIFLADVSPKPGSLPDNRSDYISTSGSPYSATYDRARNLIYVSNPSWNRVDVISNASHELVKSIPIPTKPRGIDMAVDGSRVWVATESQDIFSIDTQTLAATRYSLPKLDNLGVSESWEGDTVFCLADGTLGLYFTEATGNQLDHFAIWNPQTNSLTGISPPSGGSFPAGWSYVMRSGDGKKVYSIGSDSGGESFYYDVLAKTVSSPVQLNGYALSAAVNYDGSRVAVYYTNCLVGCFEMYNGQLNLIGSLPGGGFGGPLWSGGLIFSPDDSTLYEVSEPLHIPVIFNIDPNSLNVRSTEPALGIIPVMSELSYGFFLGVPFAVDSSGMILEMQDHGLAFDDATFVQTFSVLQPASPTSLQHMSPYFGPLAGGTTSSGFGNALSLTPDIWYGSNRGTATLQNGELAITSPPGNAQGPVNLKMLFPDGTQIFDPLFFSYGPSLEYSLLNGAPPQGNVPGQVAGFGLPYDAADATLTVASAAATITTHTSQYPPFTGEPFPSTFLNFTIPPGSPGWADVSIHTADGASTLTRAIYYGQSVIDYSSSDTFTAVLYDDKRQQLYLSAGDHVDVFSLQTNGFAPPLVPPAQGVNKEFNGLALTPDGSDLLAADTTDGSLAVVPLDNPVSSYFIFLAAPDTSDSRCLRGPLYVAADKNNQAYVAYGGVPSVGCGPGGDLYSINLGTGSAHVLQVPTPCAIYAGTFSGANVASSTDGGVVALGADADGFGRFCVYNAVAQTYATAGFYEPYGAEVSGDGNVVAAQFVFTDSTARVVGRTAHPQIFYGTNAQDTGFSSGSANLLRKPKLNDSGSLYFWASRHYFEIVDVLHGTLRMRFSLPETVLDTVAPIAIDSGGRHVYLLTDKGFTIVDLGSAPLAIGHLSSFNASSGAQITIRGSGFNPGTSAMLGGQTATVTWVDENTLTVTVPAVSSGIYDLILRNPDGSSYLLENAITVQ
ncbi:MAG TPA: IPT/TIG domain-containing protein [Terriglobales bacterium]|nr:IPT/TIG domain-containing protein [Terriglobales bacterium]